MMSSTTSSIFLFHFSTLLMHDKSLPFSSTLLCLGHR